MTLIKKANIKVNTGYQVSFTNGLSLSGFKNDLKQFLNRQPEYKKFNACMFYYYSTNDKHSGAVTGYILELIIYKSNKYTTFEAIDPHDNRGMEIIYELNDAYFRAKGFNIYQNDGNYSIITFDTDPSFNIKKYTFSEHLNSSLQKRFPQIHQYQKYPKISYNTVLPSNKELKGWLGYYPNDGEVKAFIDLLKDDLNLDDAYMPEDMPEDIPGATGELCNTTGQFGGGGNPLKDIKLFLYANKVTKGTIKLSKPQVEVGTYATDWRPNPADATKSIEMMLKQIESVKKGGRKSGKKRD